jgi:RNA polymerase sigma-70 factor, ECF subfamily
VPKSPETDVATFEEWRQLLFGIAYRMLGSAADAEDMVQEACIRWLQRGEAEVHSVRAYLVTIVTRLCMDQLTSARATRVSYTGTWLPEPLLNVDTDDMATTVEQADSLSMAFLVLLEELTPPERAAYLLHDIFGYSFDEVATSMGRTSASCRQLAARARQRIEDRRQRFDADLRRGHDLTAAFITACASGDFEALKSLLAEDVVFWSDGGGKVHAAVYPVVGFHRASRFLINVAKRLHGLPRSATLNGQPAAVFVADDVVTSALVLDILDGTIVAIRSVLNPEKLERLTRAVNAQQS